MTNSDVRPPGLMNSFYSYRRLEEMKGRSRWFGSAQSSVSLPAQKLIQELEEGRYDPINSIQKLKKLLDQPYECESFAPPEFEEEPYSPPVSFEDSTFYMGLETAPIPDITAIEEFHPLYDSPEVTEEQTKEIVSSEDAELLNNVVKLEKRTANHRKQSRRDRKKKMAKTID